MNQMTQQKEGSLMEEANFKVGRYSAEERRERIDRYRAKRTHRNFNKTIKVNFLCFFLKKNSFIYQKILSEIIPCKLYCKI